MRLLSARQLVEEALKKIGAYSINDDGADPKELESGLIGLDLVVGAMSGARRRWFLTPDSFTIPLLANVQSYNLPNELSAQQIETIQYPVSAYLLDTTNDRRRPLKIIARDQFEALDPQDQTGEPDYVHLDRLRTGPTLKTWPTPTATGFSVVIALQTLSPTVSDTFHGEEPHGLRQSWQLWAVYALSAYLGEGTIRTVPERQVDRFTKLADRHLTMLEGIEDQEQDENPLCEPYGYEGLEHTTDYGNS